MSIAFGRFSVHVLWCLQSHPYLHGDVIRWTHFPGYWPFVREFTGHRCIPAQRPVTRSFDVFFDLRMNKQLSNTSVFETPWRSLWRHCNGSTYLSVICVMSQENKWLFRGWLHVPPPRDLTATAAHLKTWELFHYTTTNSSNVFSCVTSSHIVCSLWRMCSNDWDENEMKTINELLGAWPRVIWIMLTKYRITWWIS